MKETYVIWDNDSHAFVEGMCMHAVYTNDDINAAKQFPTPNTAMIFAESLNGDYTVLRWL